MVALHGGQVVDRCAADGGALDAAALDQVLPKLPALVVSKPDRAAQGGVIAGAERKAGGSSGGIVMVQALRAVACLMVVAYHSLQAARGEAAVAAWPNLSAGVDVFFVISGFVMARSGVRLADAPRPALAFLAGRARRIVPLYWLLTALKLALAVAVPAAALHTAPDAWNGVASFLFIPSRNGLGLVRPVLPVGWTLEFEVFFYLLFALMLAARWRLAWIIVPLGVAALAAFFRQPDWPAPCILLNGLVMEFALGIGVARLAARRNFLAPAPGAVLAGIGLAALLVLPLAGNWRFLVWGLPAAAMLLGALALEACFAARMPRWLIWAGDSSYAIYLVHPFIVPALAWVVCAAAALPISIAAGIWVDRFVDAPLRRWLLRVPAGRVWRRGSLAAVQSSKTNIETRC